MRRGKIVMAGTSFEPRFTPKEERLGVRYMVATYGNLKTHAASPKDFGLSQAGRACHNYKNKRK